MAGSGDEDRKAPRSESDPLEDATAPYSIPEVDSGDDESDGSDVTEDADSAADGSDPSVSDTTTWAGPQAPPVLIEEETVVASPDAPERDAAGNAPAEDAPELDATVVESPHAPDLFQPDAPAEQDAPAGPGASGDAADPASSPPLEEATVVAAPPEPEPEPAATERDGPSPESVAGSAAEPVEAATVVDRVDTTSRAERSGGETRGTIPPSSSLHPMLLERVEPSLGRGERLRLDAAHWHVRLGRAEQNDVRLYTASASREHAEIRGNANGDWVLRPTPGKSIFVDGEAITEPVVLEVGMNLVMGGDHLRCVTEGLQRGEMVAPTAADAFRDDEPVRAGSPTGWWVIGAIAALGIGMLVFAWFSA